jgi:GTP cyclohydrolase I
MKLAFKDKTDPALGKEVRDYLIERGVETPMINNGLDESQKIDIIKQSMETILQTLGLNLSDDSLEETPKRVAKMYVQEIYNGLDYDNFPKCTSVANKMRYDEMVLEKDIKVASDCEHHLRPIFGYAHVAYIPKKTALGLSKMNRIVDFFSRRPQIQERLAEQIFHTLCFILGTDDVAVVIHAEHFCVKQRGVQDINSSTITSKLGGCFKNKPEVRAEFMSLIKMEMKN